MTVVFGIFLLCGVALVGTVSALIIGSSGSFGKDCNVTGITLYGDLLTVAPLSLPGEDDEEAAMGNVFGTRSDYIVSAIEEADEDEDVKAILLEIDSFGGLPVAAEEVANALRRSEKPTLALIRSVGTSAAYWAATGADTIVASENSDIGGIGVTYAYFEQTKKNAEEGLTYHMISSVPLKHIGDPNKSLSEEEKDLLQHDVDTVHQNFIRTIASHRNMDEAVVSELAQGASVLGGRALETGLIDAIGDLHVAKQILEERIGEEATVCWDGEA